MVKADAVNAHRRSCPIPTRHRQDCLKVSWSVAGSWRTGVAHARKIHRRDALAIASNQTLSST